MATPSRVALVTASSAGLGAAIARTLGSEFRVAINYNSSPAKAQLVLEDLRKAFPDLVSSSETDKTSSPLPPRFESFKCNLGSRAEIEKLVEDVAAQMGGIDVVVSNGGWTEIRGFADLDVNVIESDWDGCWNMNVKSHLWLLHAARRHLEKALGGGSFVTVASVAGVKPSGSSLAYAVTKAAQIHLSKSLAMMVGPSIRVNSVSPGILMTEWGQRFPESALEVAKEKTMLKRFATVEDVADVVKTLALSRSITGQNVVVDSGFSALQPVVQPKDLEGEMENESRSSIEYDGVERVHKSSDCVEGRY